MSFQVVVHRHKCDPYLYEAPLDPAEVAAWLAAWRELTLYEAPLDEDSAVGSLWSATAKRLNLPLVGAIYGHGLRINQALQLEALTGELDQLETHWRNVELAPSQRFGGCREQLKAHLLERLAFLRAAICVARDNGAVLTIS